MTDNRAPRRAAGIIAALTASVAALGQELASRPAAAPLDPVIDKILTRLESREVRDLRAAVTWELSYAIEEDQDADSKTGTLWYKQFDPVARFKVHFAHKIAGGVKRPMDEQHLFDGRWYIELQGKTRTFTRREVRRENDPGDPYKIGEGVFPLPFGQKKADILREFEVTLVPPVEGDPRDTDHLKLAPRDGTQTGRTYRELDFWVAREGPHAGLPIKVLASKRGGQQDVSSSIIITFRDIELNAGIADALFQLEPPAGYEVVEERLDPPPGGAAAEAKIKTP